MDSQINIYVLIVIYNQECSDSTTLTSLEKMKNERLNIIIADNSTVSNSNEAYSKNRKYQYISMDGNKGLSAAYNRGIAAVPKDKNSFVCLFDDDTSVPADYFQKLRAAVDSNRNADIFVPVIVDSTGLLSPCLFNGMLSKRKPEWDGKIAGCSAINTGMCIRVSVFENYQYDEGLFLDYVDHQFVLDMKAQQKTIHVFDCTLRQSFSDTSESVSKNSAMNRYSIFKKDFRYFCRKNGQSPMKCAAYLWRRRIKLCVRFKSPAFLKL